jgi:hypothetical protein
MIVKHLLLLVSKITHFIFVFVLKANMRCHRTIAILFILSFETFIASAFTQNIQPENASQKTSISSTVTTKENSTGFMIGLNGRNNELNDSNIELSPNESELNESLTGLNKTTTTLIGVSQNDENMPIKNSRSTKSQIDSNGNSTESAENFNEENDNSQFINESAESVSQSSTNGSDSQPETTTTTKNLPSNVTRSTRVIETTNGPMMGPPPHQGAGGGNLMDPIRGGFVG